MARTPHQEQNVVFPPVKLGLFGYVECWGLKRIDAWGVCFIVCALVLITHDALTVQTCLLLAAITANYWLGYWLNDYFDASYDGSNEGKARLNLFVQVPTASRYVLPVTGLILLLSMVSFVSFGWQGVVVLLLNFLIMWAYSSPPLRLKSRPGLDLLTHGLFIQTWPYVICMWLTMAAWTPMDRAILGICFLASMNGQLYQQIRDFEVDSRTDMNFTTRFGLGKTVWILKVSALFVVLLSVLAVSSGAVPLIFLPLGLLGLPKVAGQIRHRLNNPGRIFPHRLVYAIMLLALFYTGMLMIWIRTI